MIPAYRIEAAIREDGTLLLDRLPFRAGQVVEVIILPAPCTSPPDPALGGTVLRYDQPTAPVAEDGWSTSY